MNNKITKDGVHIITRHYMCRPFAELSDEDKRRVLDKYGCDWNTDHGWWDCVYENFETDMLDKHGMNVNLERTYFTGFGCQGNGATFEATLDMEKFIDTLPPVHQEAGALVRKHLDALDIGVSISGNGHFYTQGAGMELVGHHTLEDEQSELFTRIDKAVDELGAYLQELCRDEAKNLFRKLEKEYDYLTSEECLAESFAAGNCLFEIGTGRMFYADEETS